MQLISRAQAIAKGLNRYYTGIPCKFGHDSVRVVGNRNCMACRLDPNLPWAKRNRDNRKGTKKARRGRNQRFYAKHRQEILDRTNRWKRENLNLCRAYNAKRRATKLQCTPPWAEHEEIRKFYEACPEGYQVDHIVPLQSEIVCGLHVLANLQYLTISENASKGNQLPAT